MARSVPRCAWAARKARAHTTRRCCSAPRSITFGDQSQHAASRTEDTLPPYDGVRKPPHRTRTPAALALRVRSDVLFSVWHRTTAVRSSTDQRVRTRDQFNTRETRYCTRPCQDNRNAIQWTIAISNASIQLSASDAKGLAVFKQSGVALHNQIGWKADRSTTTQQLEEHDDPVSTGRALKHALQTIERPGSDPDHGAGHE